MSRTIRITDHALLRWLERSGALDVEVVRAMLAASLARGMAAGAELGTANFAIVADGLIYKVRDGKLVTVVEDSGLAARVRASR
jgi:hypothetical protein